MSPNLKDILVILFIGLGFYLAYKLFNCRKNSWPRKHRGLYGYISLGVLQLPLFVVPVGYLCDCKPLWAWIALYVASFGIFAALYRKWHGICQKSDKKTYSAHCYICGNDFQFAVYDHVTEIGCSICGNPILRRDWKKVVNFYYKFHEGVLSIVWTYHPSM